MASLSLTARLARTSSHRPWRTVALWVVALVAFGAIQGALPLESTADVTLLNNPNRTGAGTSWSTMGFERSDRVPRR